MNSSSSVPNGYEPTGWREGNVKDNPLGEVVKSCGDGNIQLYSRSTN